MPKEEWGRKHRCPSEECGIKFYDLLRSPIACPVCGTVVVLATVEAKPPEFDEEAEAKETATKQKQEIPEDEDILDEDDEDEVDLDDDVLDEDDTVSLESIADLSDEDED